MNSVIYYNKRARTISMILVLVMLVTILPVWPSLVNANGSLTIDYPGTQGNELGKDPSTPIQVSDRNFRLTGSFSGFSVVSISYTVRNLGTGHLATGGTPYNTPGTSNYIYENIQLTPGLNEITIQSTTGVNRKVFVEYNDMPGIFNLTVNGTNLVSDEVVINATQVQGQAIAGAITGLATNSTQVIITNQTLIATNSNASVSAQVFGATGFFSSTIPLTTGENIITFTARNETKSVTETRRIIVNTITAGAGMNVYNLQSHYTFGSTITKNVPKNGQVDIVKGTSNSTLNNKNTYMTVNGQLQFTGRLIVNPGGAGYTELNQFRTVGTNRVYSDILFEVQDNTGTPLVAKQSLLSPSAITTASLNPQNIIAADQALFQFQRQATTTKTQLNNIANISVGAPTDPIGVNNANLIINNLPVSATANTLQTRFADANNALIGADLATIGLLLDATALNTAVSDLNAVVSGITATTTWGAIIAPSAVSLETLVNNFKTEAATYHASITAIDTTGSPSVLAGKFTEVSNLAANNGAITKDNAESNTNIHFYDFVSPVVNAAALGLQHNKTYRIIIEPRFYRTNPTTVTDYLNTFNTITYEFTYIDSDYPVINNLQNRDTGEIIYNVTPPSTNYYRIGQKPFNLRINFQNFTTGVNRVQVMHKAAPYPTTLSGSGITLDGDISVPIVAGDITNGYVDVELPNLLTGNNLIEVHYSDGTNSIVEKRVVLVVTTPLVTIRNATNQEVIANNRVYEFLFNPAVPSENEAWFLGQNFGNIQFNFTGLSDTNRLGSATNPLHISLNDKPVIVGGIITSTPVGANNVVRARTPQPIGTDAITSVNVNFTHSDIHTALNPIFRQGLNKLTVQFNNGLNPMRVDLEFYLFTESSPSVNDIRVTDNRVTDKAIVNFEPYTTDGDQITIRGTVKNSDKLVLRIQGMDVAEYQLIGGVWTQISTQLPTGRFQIDSPIGTENESEFRIVNYPLQNPSDNVLQGTFVFVVEASQGHTTVSRPITIMKKTDPYTVLAPYRKVTNNNYEKIIIKADGANGVSIGKDQVQKIRLSDSDVMSEYVRDWLSSHLYGRNQSLFDSLGADAEVFFAEVPLKKGANKIAITVDFGSQKVNGTIDIFYAATAQVGAVYKTDLNKNNIKPAELENKIQLTFPKGTLLQRKNMQIQGEFERYEDSYDVPNFWADKNILIGIADYETGKVDRDIAKSTRADLRMSLNNSYYNNFFQYASDLYFIDAGDLTHPGGRLPYESPEIVTRRIEDSLEPTKRGTITLTYNNSIVLDAGPHLAIMYNPGYTSIGSQAGWKNLGGVVNTKSKTISVPFEGFGYYTVMKLNRSLPDMIFHPWGRRNLEAMFSKGIMISEPGTNRFGTDLNITRGEFVTMLVKAIQIPVNAGPYVRQGISTLRPVNNSFDDILPGMGDFFWEYPYLETAARAGIIQGKAPGLFMPNEQLTREQAAVIIARAIEAKVVRTPELAMNQLTKDFTDASQVDTYARQAVAAIAKTGIVVGKLNDPNDPTRGSSFLPKNNLTRAEASVIATRLMQQQKLLPDPL
ncbi:hypothetical protein BHU72_05095 [Desulfuribacillus stibiiarsenatis]|uniref:SLH domain-containing protein n=1 Tax=Desulfuribacillus stibiiarsenatis TaxID=1390249 RepID=A0A1E5L5X1_9FIRM|nr:S-layer homology domain-containing protein [Desulfuribacillus stibiiarsenatis]OEH85464.1 hypothetical protein BHU72_05095 [Desulfuribacillus stibiiarsenatis]